MYSFLLLLKADLVVNPEHHVGELDHGVTLDLCEGDDVVKVVHQLLGGLIHRAQVFSILNTQIRIHHHNVIARRPRIQ
jgi:hypothetical protein